MNFRSVADLNDTVIRNLGRVPKDVSLVVGIPRSGMLAANLLALHLNLPVSDLDGLLVGRIMACGGRTVRGENSTASSLSGRILVIDDSLDSGRSMLRAKTRVAAAGLAEKAIFAAVYVSLPGRGKVDLSFEEIVGHRVFEWNLMHHSLLPRACVDIDGILCNDPTETQNDDGPLYERFLRDTPPKVIPSYRIGRLVTARLEKYRRQTEAWLAQHGIRYDQLVMLDLPDKAARQAAGTHGTYKASVYRESGAELFIESSRRQALEIAMAAQRPVLSYDTREMIYPSLRTCASKAASRLPRALARRVAKLAAFVQRRLLQVDPPRRGRSRAALPPNPEMEL